MILIIGNKRFSSWSLRPWLVLTHFQIPFEEKLLLLDRENTDEEIAKYGTGGTVPILVDGDLTVGDSLAICEYANDHYPEKKMWPENLVDRARARAVACEMHSGFQTMRELMPHDLQKKEKVFTAHQAREDIERVKKIWIECLERSGGPFLFGDFSIADAMYAPVVNRFISYAAPVDAEREKVIADYLKTIRELPAHLRWIEAGEKEAHVARFH